MVDSPALNFDHLIVEGGPISLPKNRYFHNRVRPAHAVGLSTIHSPPSPPLCEMFHKFGLPGFNPVLNCHHA